jgi:hypothetical protein
VLAGVAVLATLVAASLRRQGLLGVDHLATRLRRTAETPLAVTGPDPARRSTRPLPVSTLLLAAIAEAEPGGSGREGAPAPRDGSGGRGGGSRS